jgi:transcriptional regulator with XRE-family HTH domain
MADTTTNTTIPEWDLGDRMRKALRHGGVSVHAMAEYLDVSLGSLHAWTSGRTKPRVQTLRLWALRTGVDYDWLANGTTSHLGSEGWGFESLRARSSNNVIHLDDHRPADRVLALVVGGHG